MSLLIGRFLLPINTALEVPGNSITYVGHVDMVSRKQQEDERRSGAIIPVMDSFAAGFADGTIDVFRVHPVAALVDKQITDLKRVLVFVDRGISTAV